MRTSPLNQSHLSVCLAGCLILCVVGVGLVTAEESYDLTVTDAVEVPPQTVDDPHIDNEHEVDAFAVRQPGEPLDVTATVPDGERFYVDLYNSDHEWETGFEIEGSESVTFDGTTTSALEPGTYSLLLDEVSGPVQAIHPVVVSGYEISVTYPDEVERDGTLDVEIDLTPTALDDDPAEVEVVLWNDSDTITVLANGSDGEYSASIDLDGMDVGEYKISAAALGDEEFRGQSEVLGLSERGTIDVIDSDPVDNEMDADQEANDVAETDESSENATEDAEIVDESVSSESESDSASEQEPIEPEEISTAEDQSGFGVLPAAGAIAFIVCSLLLRRSVSP